QSTNNKNIVRKYGSFKQVTEEAANEIGKMGSYQCKSTKLVYDPDSNNSIEVESKNNCKGLVVGIDIIPSNPASTPSVLCSIGTSRQYPYRPCSELLKSRAPLSSISRENV